MVINRTNTCPPDDWRILTIGQLSRMPLQNGLYKQRSDYGSGVKMIHMGEVFAHDRVTDQNMRRAQLSGSELEKFTLENGDLVFARRSLKPEGAGVTSIVYPTERMTFESSIIRVSLNGEGNPEFVILYLKSPYGRAQMMTIVRQVAVSGITGTDLKKYQIPLPPMAEQEKLAKIFFAWNQAIKTTEKLIENSKAKKKALMQQLLTGKKRLPGFSGVWQTVQLKEIAKVLKGIQINRDTLSADGTYPVINGGVRPSGYTDRYNRQKNTITISEGGNSCGFVGMQKQEFWCGGHCYSIEKATQNQPFLYHRLKHDENRIMRLRVGSGLPNIQKKDVEALKLSMPTSAAEQEKIAVLLDTSDREVTTANHILERLRREKRSLMQQLLTGKRRVKVAA